VLVYAYGYMGIMQMACCWLFYFMAPGILGNLGKSNFTAAEAGTNKVASTLYYYTLVVGQIAAALATTTYDESLFKYLVPNSKLNICIVLEIIFAVLIIYSPSLEGVFMTTGLTAGQMLLPWASFVFISICEEVRKAIRRCRGAGARAREPSAAGPLSARLLEP